MSQAPDESLLVWVDMEMTGLRPDHDRIIEVALVITDESLTVRDSSVITSATSMMRS